MSSYDKSKDATFLSAANEDPANAQADLSLCRAHMSEGPFSDVVVQLYLYFTHLCRVDSSTSCLWTGPFLI